MSSDMVCIKSGLRLSPDDELTVTVEVESGDERDRYEQVYRVMRAEKVARSLFDDGVQLYEYLLEERSDRLTLRSRASS